MSRIVVLRRPFAHEAMQRELEELFQRQWGRPVPSAVQHDDGMWQPQVDVYEVDEAFVVLVELAGMRDQQFDVTLAEEALLIAGRRPELHREGTRRFHQLAINEGPFHAVVLLPGPVVEDGVSAAYDDGFLTITLPKRRPQTHRIEVASNRQ